MNNKHRGDPDMKKRRCRWSREGIEDDAHILNKCRMKEGLITKRHDFIVNKIGKELKRQSDQSKIWIRRACRCGRELWRPDVKLVKNDHSFLIEVTCPYERSAQYLKH